MKFETPKMNISLFAAENVVTDASGIANSETVVEAKSVLTNETNKVAAANIFEFTF